MKSLLVDIQTKLQQGKKAGYARWAKTMNDLAEHNVYQYDCDGKPIVQLPKESPVRKALHDIVQKLGL